MKSMAVHVLMIACLAAATIPLVAATTGDLSEIVVVSPGKEAARAPTPTAPEAATQCILNVLFCYQCNDGADNDGDGLIDYPNDPSCDSPSDNDEYTCVYEYPYAEITSAGSKYGTDVLTQPTLVYSCPGGARLIDPYNDCAPISNVGWVENSCTSWTPASRSSGGQASYTCASGGACTGAISPHTLKAAIVLLDDFGSYACQFQATTGVAFTTQCV